MTPSPSTGTTAWHAAPPPGLTVDQSMKPSPSGTRSQYVAPHLDYHMTISGPRDRKITPYLEGSKAYVIPHIDGYMTPFTSHPEQTRVNVVTLLNETMPQKWAPHPSQTRTQHVMSHPSSTESQYVTSHRGQTII